MEVTRAKDGQESLDHVGVDMSSASGGAPNTFDLVMMDVSLGPGIDGITAASKIREWEAKLKSEVPKGETGVLALPIIGLSASESHRERSLEVGMDLFCTKPLQAEHLLQAVLQCTVIRRSARARARARANPDEEDVPVLDPAKGSQTFGDERVYYNALGRFLSQELPRSMPLVLQALDTFVATAKTKDLHLGTAPSGPQAPTYSPQQLAYIEKVIKALGNLGEAGHSMKGSSSFVCALAFSRAAHGVERCCKGTIRQLTQHIDSKGKDKKFASLMDAMNTIEKAVDECFLSLQDAHFELVLHLRQVLVQDEEELQRHHKIHQAETFVGTSGINFGEQQHNSYGRATALHSTTTVSTNPGPTTIEDTLLPWLEQHGLESLHDDLVAVDITQVMIA